MRAIRPFFIFPFSALLDCGVSEIHFQLVLSGVMTLRILTRVLRGPIGFLIYVCCCVWKWYCVFLWLQCSLFPICQIATSSGHEIRIFYFLLPAFLSFVKTLRCKPSQDYNSISNKPFHRFIVEKSL